MIFAKDRPYELCRNAESSSLYLSLDIKGQQQHASGIGDNSRMGAYRNSKVLAPYTAENTKVPTVRHER